MRRRVSGPGRGSGFTSVEVAILIVLVAALVVLGYPRFRKSVERARAGEAFEYLTAVRQAQRHHMARTGHYANDIRELTVQRPALRYFKTAAMTVSSPSDGTLPTWSLALTRSGAAPCFEGYTVTFNQDGLDSRNSTIARFPEINPIDHSGDETLVDDPGTPSYRGKRRSSHPAIARRESVGR